MIDVQGILVSDDIRQSYFVCDLNKCKGACCVEGDLGAPLEDSELPIMEKILPKVMPYLSDEGKEAIEAQGAYLLDCENVYSTPMVGDGECAYAVYNDQGILQCSIEQAYNDGKINFKKPVSCHLYPIRVSRLRQGEALNYDEWNICNPACNLGKALQVPLYVFLKEPLIRKYGQPWYDELVAVVEAYASQNSETP